MTLAPSSPAAALLDAQLDDRERSALTAGDRHAWERQYREIHGPLYGYCLKLTGDETTALDLVQETFARAMKRCREAGTPTTLRAYLYTSARNLHIDEIRRRSKSDARSAEDVATDMADEDAALRDTDPDVGAVVSEQRDDVRAALATLPDRQRQALALCDMEGCSYAQVGEALGLKENAVAQLVFRARGRLRLALRLRQVDERTLPEGCRDTLEPISRLLDGALKGDALAELEAHLAGCEACSTVRDDFELVQRRYRAFLPLLPFGAKDAWAHLLDEKTAAREALVDDDPSRRWARRSTLLLTLLLLLLLLATGVGVASFGGDDPAAPLRAVQASGEDAVAEDEGDAAPAATTPHGSKHKRRHKHHVGGSSGSGEDSQEDSGHEAATDKPTAHGHGHGHGTRRPTHGGGSHQPAPGSGDTTTSGGSDQGTTTTDTGTTTTTTTDPGPASGSGSGTGTTTQDPPPPPPPGPPNLVANSVTYVGGFDVSISNTGETSSGSFTVKVSTATQSYYGSSGSIAPGGSTVVHVNSPCLEGSFSFTAIADVYGAVSETSEADNSAAGKTSSIC
jgi:RNA polymerase sigma-70 factor (ECF subfamily)